MNKILMLVFTGLIFIFACGKSTNHTISKLSSTKLSDKLEGSSEMAFPRSGHSATLLPNGEVLIAGGMEKNREYHNSAEIFSPKTNLFTSVQNLNQKRVGHSSVLLKDGKVLILGGFGDDGILSSAELFDPMTGSFTNIESLNFKRGNLSATLLNDGTVLITGGEGESGSPLSSAEIYNPSTGLFTPTGNMNSARTQHTATLLDNGKVLIAGGGSYQNPLSSAEIYNPDTKIFTNTGNMSAPICKHAAVKLNDGNVMILGGSDVNGWNGNYTNTQIYNVQTGVFSKSGDMLEARFKITNSVVLLQSGNILISGGYKQSEIYDTKENSFNNVNGEMDLARYYSTATLLNDGRVLITGGYDTQGIATNRAWIFNEQ